uniref:GSKIP domain-containing protein n=1 Tax=Acrobeloides nanus TaxID=290746 RepID=A0A914CRB0_9BILA
MSHRASGTHTPITLSHLTHASCENCGLSLLENEAISAVREVSGFVKSIWISEVLPRTPDLIFLNITSIEGLTYCIELTQRGWRICSDKEDCMYGDFRRLELHAKYFETIYQLLDQISAEYRNQFGKSLEEKLQKLASEEKKSDEALTEKHVDETVKR